MESALAADRKAPPALDAAEISRYARQLTLPEVGREGQARLREAGVVVVGLGGLGSPALLYLAAAGVGRIGLVEQDRVEESNLQRQVLYTTAQVGREKLVLARERIEAINPRLRVEQHDLRLDADNAAKILAGYDVVLDATDNFPSRYAINDACAALGKADVFGSVFRLEGRATVFWAGRGPCYRCLYPEPPPAGSVPDPAEAGVLGVLPGIIGTVQAAEAIKLILGRGEPLLGRFLVLDALQMRFRELKLRRNPDCRACGEAARKAGRGRIRG
jgi:adenylyltransferase/sulfurtransferase